MGLKVFDKGGASFAPLEAGTYLARCVGLIDLGLCHNDFYNKDQQRVRIIWELPTETVNVDGEDKPRWMSKTYTASLSDKATLRKDLDNWRGKPFTPQELKGFELRNIVGAPCILTVQHKEGQNGAYAVVGGVGKVMKGMTVPELTQDPIIFDMDSGDCFDVFETLPEWMQKELFKDSLTWQELTGGVDRNTESGEDGDPGDGQPDGEEEKIPF